MHYILAILSGATIGVAWLVPNTVSCAVLGWLGIFALLLSVTRSERPYKSGFLAGVTAITLGFYWLLFTIRDFSGFPTWSAILIFALFVATSALQFIFFVFIWRRLPASLDLFFLRAPIAWCVAEFLPYRIFPWQIGHTQIAFLKFAQVSDIAGSITISFIMVWCCAALLPTSQSEIARGNSQHNFYQPSFLARALPFCTLILALAYGTYRLLEVRGLPSAQLNVALVQGNITVEEKRSVKYISANIEQYRSLTQAVTQIAAERASQQEAQLAARANTGLLVVWPESALTEWFSVDIAHTSLDRRLPYYGNHVAMVLGTLTFSDQEQYHNSALGIDPSGAVVAPYHKQILMPFGEYTPLGSIFPWLKTLNANVSDFTPGTQMQLIEFKNGVGDFTRPIRIAPLICYEDIIVSPALTGSRLGANLLINLTNDGWFGNTAAPHQHHMIATFRAIETRRPLLRATNSGYTAIVDNTGATVADLPIFSAGVAQYQLAIPESPSSVFVDYVGSKLWWILTMFCTLAIFLNAIRSKRILL